MTHVVSAITALDENDLIQRPLRLTERQTYDSTGYLHLDGLWTASFGEALSYEARARYSFAEVPQTGPRTPVDENRRARRQTLAATGPLLARLHLSMISVVRALSGRLVVPTFSAYGYYETHDEVLLHLDSDQCDVTLLTAVLGRVKPLHLRPELCGSTMDELGSLENNPTWDRAGGVQVEYPKLGLMALAGNLIPHNRPKQSVPELSAVAALCYRSLF
jgi:hypothetical protein